MAAPSTRSSSALGAEVRGDALLCLGLVRAQARLRGSVGFRVGRKKLVAGPGRRLTVPAGTPHKFWNAGEEAAHFVCEVRPAPQFEALLETMFALAAASSSPA